MVEFSVVISVFNKEPHVARAIRSVLAQTHRPREVVVVDDASTDQSVRVIQDLAGDGVKLIRQPAAGPAGYEARNRGTHEATSDWIAFLDADDAWEPHHLRTLSDALDHAPATVGCVFAGHVSYFGSRNDRRPEKIAFLPVARTEQIDFARLLGLWLALKRCPINASGIAVKRNVLLEVGGFPAGRCLRGGDKDLWLRICAATDAIAVSAITSVYYRDAVNMVSKTTSMNRMPCLCHTIARLLARREPHCHELLQRLHNREVLNYAFRTWRREAFDGSQFRTFYPARDPIGFVLLLAMKTVPGSRLQTLRSVIRRLRAALAQAG